MTGEYAFKPSCLSTEYYGLILLVISAVLFSGMGCFVKLAASTGLPSTELVFLRATFQGAFVVVGMIHCRATTEAQGGKDFSLTSPQRPLLWRPFGGTPEVRRIVILRGAIGGFGFVNYYYTMSALPLGDAITLLSLYPILAIFSARAYLGETIRYTQLVAAVSSLAGAVLIARPVFIFGGAYSVGDMNGGSRSLGYLTAALGACSASAVIVLIRKAGTIGAHTLQLLFSWTTFGIAFGIALGSLVGEQDGGAWHLPSSTTAWLYVFGLCSIGSVAHFLLNFAGRLAPAGLSSIARSTDITWGYLLQILVLKEKPMASTLFGVALVFVSLVMVAVQKWLDEKGAIQAAAADAPEKLHLLHDRGKDPAVEPNESHI